MRQTLPCKLLFGAFHYAKHSAEAGSEELYLANCRQLLRVLCQKNLPRVTLFINGTLLELIERHCHTTADALRQLVRERRVELLSSSFYDSQLALLPIFSRSTHIERMTSQLSRMVRKRPQGFWLDLGIWDPVLPLSLDKAGLRYVFLPSGQLRQNLASRMFSPLMTEEHGRSVFLLPLHSDDLLPSYSGFLEAEELLRRIQQLQHKNINRSEAESTFISCFIDGQNPRYDYHWYLKFFQLLEDAEMETQLPSSYLQDYEKQQTNTPLLFPSATCVGNMLPTPSKVQRNRRASYRQLFILHGASRLLLNRFHYSQLLASQMRGDKQRRKEALHLLWRGCAHQAYLPLAHGLASAAERQWCYRQFIRCEKICRAQSKPSLSAMDYNTDGVDEYVFRGTLYNAVIQQQGGSLLEWEDLVGERSFASIFSDHDLPTASFADRVSLCHQRGQTPNTVTQMRRIEQDLSRQYYRLEQQRNHAHQLRLVSNINLPELRENLLLQKTYLLEEEQLKVEYQLTRINYQEVYELFFYIELHLNLPTDTVFLTTDPHGQQLQGRVNNQIDITALSNLALISPSSRSQLQLSFSQPLNVNSQPIYTLVGGGSGSQVYFQGVKLRLRWLVEADWFHHGQLSICCRNSALNRRENRPASNAPALTLHG